MSSVPKMIADFAARSATGAFTKISRGDVAKGLKERIANPEKIDQGKGSLCGPAALMFSVLRKDPWLYVRYVISLYDNGHGVLGDSPGIWVTPGKDCKNFKPNGKIPPVDWIALASLRDSENDFIDYQDTSDQAAGITPPVTLGLWLKKCGFDPRRNETNLFLTKDKVNLETASALHQQLNAVCLFCKGATLDGENGGFTSTPSHWVVMTKPAMISSGNISLQVFSWGDLKNLKMALSTFLSTYFGFVAGRP